MKHYDSNGLTDVASDLYMTINQYYIKISPEAKRLLGDKCYISVDDTNTKEITISLIPAKDYRALRIHNDYDDEYSINKPSGLDIKCDKAIKLMPRLEVNIGIPNVVYLEGVIKCS